MYVCMNVVCMLYVCTYKGCTVLACRYQIVFGLGVELLAYVALVALVGPATSGKILYVYKVDIYIGELHMYAYRYCPPFI